MKLLVACDAHIFITPDGKHWCKSIYGYNFWERYLEVFENVRIVARMKPINKVDSKYLLIDGKGVEIYGIPFYQGPKQLLINYIKIQKRLRNVDNGCDAALLRLPSQTAFMVYNHIHKNKPIAGEIVYDMINDVNALNQNMVIKILNIITSNRLKKFCMKANGVSYVTEYSIQNHYPSYARINGQDKAHFETSYSTITLADDAYESARNYAGKNSFTLVLTSVSMNDGRKGEKTLIDIVKIVRSAGENVSAILIGDGKLRNELEKYSIDIGVSDYVTFTGLLSASEVKIKLQEADIFVFPTWGEGLPRGIIEAMAVGMPVLSTYVGGIPELIDQQYLFSPSDVEGFANTVIRLCNNIDELEYMSCVNFKKSQLFKNSILQPKRNEFYRKLLNLVILKDEIFL